MCSQIPLKICNTFIIFFTDEEVESQRVYMTCTGSHLTDGRARIQTLFLPSIIVNLYVVNSFIPWILGPDVIHLLHIIIVHSVLKVKH